MMKWVPWVQWYWNKLWWKEYPGYNDTEINSDEYNTTDYNENYDETSENYNYKDYNETYDVEETSGNNNNKSKNHNDYFSDYNQISKLLNCLHSDLQEFLNQEKKICFKWTPALWTH